MTDRPVVSVSLTTYQRAHLLGRCLASVLSQTCRSTEVVVVDDGSTDGTQETVAQVAQADHRVRYVRHPRNMGNAAARNTAFRNCSGTYVAFMDDDDEWIDPQKLEKQLAAFERQGQGDLAIVCTSINLVSSDGSIRPKTVRKPDDLAEHILTRNGVIYSPTVLTRRCVLERVGGFDERFRRGVDAEFYRACIVGHGLDVEFLPDITTNVHEHGPGRLSYLRTPEAIESHFRTYELALETYAQQYRQYPRAKLYAKMFLARNYIRYLLRTPSASVVAKLLALPLR